MPGISPLADRSYGLTGENSREVMEVERMTNGRYWEGFWAGMLFGVFITLVGAVILV
jgi:hypothetical protein